MLVRLLQIGIVILWLGATSWLVREVWFPAESRFAAVDSGEVVRRFFEWNESANLVLLESGRRIGLMTVNGYSGIDRSTGEFEEGLSIVGTLDPIAKGNRAPFSRAGLNGIVEFGPERKLKEAQFSMRLPVSGLSAHLAVNGVPLQLKAHLKVGDAVLFQTEGPLSVEPGSFSEPAPLELPENLPFGLSLQAGGIRDRILDWKPEISARRGRTRLGGSDVPVYLLALTSPEHYELKVWLTEIGEPLRIESNWGLEAVAEVLAPVQTIDLGEWEEDIAK